MDSSHEVLTLRRFENLVANLNWQRFSQQWENLALSSSLDFEANLHSKYNKELFVTQC
jgi:hypothetical protein